jgi:hypothetical protein
VCDEIGAVVSQVGDPASEGQVALAATPENLWRHERVVEAVCAAGPALPVRFGTVLPDADAVTHALRTRYDTLLQDLRRLGDKREVTVTALWTPESDATAQRDRSPGDSGPPGVDTSSMDRRPGLAYLRGRQAEYRRAEEAHERAEALAHDVRDKLRPLAVDCHLSVCPAERLAVRAVFLLDSARMPAFAGVFEELRQRHREARFLLSGPWPPYSFVASSARHDALAPAGERIESQR